MKINPDTLLFEDLTEFEASDLLRWASNVVLKGEISGVVTTFVDEWMAAAGLTDNNRLLVISTVLPQRVLLSLLLNPPKKWTPRVRGTEKRSTGNVAADLLSGSGGVLDRSGALTQGLEEED